ncbi:hypothetical protein HK100_008956 [Physocladia obscura]|uniref:Uncharacterized protein n=1 Tax=Physocladia obscura TaxID=109957 RepID=A0AAD5T4E9_9FUNG|nr:hypothetical protein HK100_008956 [Physocladia obscura]
MEAKLDWLLDQGPMTRPAEAADAIACIIANAGSVPGFASSALTQIHARLRDAGDNIAPKVVELVAFLLSIVGKHPKSAHHSTSSTAPPSGATPTQQQSSHLAQRDLFVTKFVKINWPPKLVNALALAFSDLPLSPIAHELLTHRRPILVEIISHISHLDETILGHCFEDHEGGSKIKKSQKDFIRIEGTIILQICFGMRQNMELGNEFLALIKSEINIFFRLLAITQIHRFEVSAQEILKLMAVTACKDCEHIRGVKWINSETKSSAWPQAIWETMHRIIFKSEYWDNITPELTQYAFMLLESSGTTVSTKHNQITANQSLRKIWSLFDLGSHILFSLSRMHDQSAHTILDKILSRIIAKPIALATFAEILESIVLQRSAMLSQFTPKITDALMSLGSVPVHESERFLWAIRPLFEHNGANTSFRDELLIPLRKGMFNSELSVRRMSVATMVHILKLIESPSESSGSQDILKRGMNQQYDIRVQLYEGFLAIVDKQPWMGIFTRYYEDSSAIRAPMRLDVCFDGTTLSEPLPLLLVLVMECILVSRESSRETVSECTEMFENMVQRLVKADMADFEINKDGEFASDSEESRKNRMMIDCLIGIYEVSIEYAMMEKMDDNQVDLVLILFRKSCVVRNLIKEKLKSKKGFANKIYTHMTPSSSISRRISMLEALFSKDAVARLQNNQEFVHQIMVDTLAVLNKITTPANAHYSNSQLFDDLTKLACILFKNILTSNSELVILYTVKSVERGIFLSAVECFEKLFSFITTYSGKDGAKAFFLMLSRIFSDDKNTPANNFDDVSKIGLFVEGFKNLIADILHANIPYTRESILLINVLANLWSFLSNGDLDSGKLDYLTADLQNWSLELWRKDRSILSRNIVDFFCSMQRKTCDFSKLLELISDVQKCVGKMVEEEDEDSQDDGTIKIPEKDIPAIISSVLSNVDENLEEVKWTISKLKTLGIDDILKLRLESTLYNHMNGMCVVLYEILRSDLPFEAVDATFSTLIKTFKVVNALLKYKISCPEITNRFEILVDTVSDKLRDTLNEIIPTLQERDSENVIPADQKKGSSFKKRKRSVRESKTIPTLIFETEQFDRYLIALHKKSGGNLMKYVKRSTARDFRIQEKKISAKEKEGGKKEGKNRKEKKTKKDLYHSMDTFNTKDIATFLSAVSHAMANSNSDYTGFNFESANVDSQFGNKANSSNSVLDLIDSLISVEESDECFHKHALIKNLRKLMDKAVGHLLDSQLSNISESSKLSSAYTDCFLVKIETLQR